MKTFTAITLWLMASFVACASTVIEVLPLTDQILMIHFDDGYVQYHQQGENFMNQAAFVSPLAEALADQPAQYALLSEEDSSYRNAKAPVAVNRKSKGTEFAWLCEGWAFLPFYQSMGCDNTTPDFAKEHWVYLHLPTAMERGATYTLRTGTLADNENSFLFRYDPAALRSEAVHVNNLGYCPGATAKYAYVYHWLGDGAALDLAAYAGRNFAIRDLQTDEDVFTGVLRFRQGANEAETGQENTDETPNRNFHRSQVYECDFSVFDTPGEYILYVDGIGSSFPFVINCGAYRPAYRAVMRGLYGNRSGVPLPATHFNQSRPADHHVRLTPGFGGRLKYSTTTLCDVSDIDAAMEDKSLWEAGFLGNLEDTWGWYQDAGDWDAYPRHGQVPAKLLFTYEHFSENFSDSELDTPDENNGLPDILDEASFLIQFYHRLRHELIDRGWGTGGVGGARVFGDLWGEDIPNDIARGSWQDTDRTWVVSGEEAVTTYYYAALSAHYAFLLGRDGLTDPSGIDWQAEARNAFTWAVANETDVANCTNLNLSEAKLYATASLLRLTEELSYQQAFITALSATDLEMGSIVEDESSFGIVTYLGTSALTANDIGTRNFCRTILVNTGDYLLQTTLASRACRWGGNYYMPMLVGQSTTPLIFSGIMAYALLRDTDTSRAEQYLAAMHTTADYFLGTNPLNMTWITDVGERSPEDILHLDSWVSTPGTVREGIVPYGPWRQQALSNDVGPWDIRWANQTLYPGIDQWPGHERWFNIRSAPFNGEFTVDQTNTNAAVLYGALAGTAGCNQPTRIKDPVDSYSLSVYPNPTLNVVYLRAIEDSPVHALSLFSINGKRLLHQVDPVKLELSLNNLPDGVYILCLKYANGQQQQARVVKQ